MAGLKFSRFLKLFLIFMILCVYTHKQRLVAVVACCSKGFGQQLLRHAMAAMIHAESRNPYHCFMVDGRPVWAWRSQVQYKHILQSISPWCFTHWTQLHWNSKTLDWKTCWVESKTLIGTLTRSIRVFWIIRVAVQRYNSIHPSYRVVQHSANRTYLPATNQSNKGRGKNGSKTRPGDKVKVARKEKKGTTFGGCWLFLLERKCGNSVIHKGESEIEILHNDPWSQRNMDFIMRLSSRMRLAHHDTHAVEGISSPNIQKQWDRHLVEQMDQIYKWTT